MYSNFIKFDYLWLVAALVAGGILGFFFGAVVGLSCSLCLILILFCTHLGQLKAFLIWLESDSSAPPLEFRGVWKDVALKLQKTKRKKEKSSAKLKDKEQQFLQTINSLPDGVVLVKHNWEIELVNPPAERDFILNGVIDAGRPIFEVYKNENLKSYLESGSWEQPLVLNPSDGRKIEVRVFPAGKKYFIIVSRDETEPMRLDAMRRDFVANVSHELRTPLTVIKGFLELLEDQPNISEDEKLHLKMMSDQADRMGVLVDDLLALSRLERDGAPAQKTPVNVHDLLVVAANEGNALSQGRHTIEIDRVDSQMILCDPKEMQSAISNLMTNAVRYTPDGGTIKLSYYLNDEGGNVVVQDNGIGIAKEDIPRVTERFYRVDKSRSRETGGTGLGLAIVKHVLFRHQAQLKIESELGKGSTFKIILPLRRIIENQKPVPIGETGAEKAIH